MKFNESERLDYWRLAQSQNVGPVTFRMLMQKFGSATAALEALPELAQRGGAKRGIKIYPKDVALQDFERATRHGARFVANGEEGYGDLLGFADAAPPMLCVKGQTSFSKLNTVAIVGARNASANGMKYTRMIASALGEAGYAVASGLARGIDTAAHQASVERQTIAVVAGGIDHFYPPENTELQRAISERGLLVSEMPIGTVPKAEHFPRRNRIISGISKAVIIVEAALRSGSLITARYAGEQNRDVFAVPGSPLDPRCEGTNRLIRDGAQIITSIEDLIRALDDVHVQCAPTLFEPPAPITDDVNDNDRAHLLQLLTPEPTHIDDIIRESGLAPGHVQYILLEAEIAGLVHQLKGGHYARAIT